MVFDLWIVVASIRFARVSLPFLRDGGSVGVFLLWCNFNESHFLVFCVVSVLGRMVDALASEADEGRGRLRYASGSCQPSVDPRMSEWGNPARVMSCHPALNT